MHDSTWYDWLCRAPGLTAPKCGVSSFGFHSRCSTRTLLGLWRLGQPAVLYSNIRTSTDWLVGNCRLKLRNDVDQLEVALVRPVPLRSQLWKNSVQCAPISLHTYVNLFKTLKTRCCRAPELLLYLKLANNNQETKVHVMIKMNSLQNLLVLTICTASKIASGRGNRENGHWLRLVQLVQPIKNVLMVPSVLQTRELGPLKNFFL